MPQTTTAILTIVLIWFGFLGCNDPEPEIQIAPEALVDARAAMIADQIEGRAIDDPRVVDAMSRVERHLFVPREFWPQAYNDHPLPIGEDQTISQPYIVALMTELAQVDSTDRVLEIGTGSGYQAAILGELADSVFTMEVVKPLARRSARLLDSLGYDKVLVRHGDGYAGWPEHAPYDAILVTCAPPKVPPPLIDQLADGGRMVIPVGEWYQELILIERTGDSTVTRSVIAVRFVPMTGDGVKSHGETTE